MKLSLCFIVFGFTSVTFAGQNQTGVAAVPATADLPAIEIIDVTGLKPRPKEEFVKTAPPLESTAPIVPIATTAAVEPIAVLAPVEAAPPAVSLVPTIMTGLRVERHIRWQSDKTTEVSKSPAAKIHLKFSWKGGLAPEWSEQDLKTLQQAASVILAIKPEQVPPLKRDVAGAFYETEFVLKSGLLLPGSKPTQLKLSLIHPIHIQLQKIREGGKTDLGPAGDIYVTTRVEQFPGVEHEGDDCLVSTRWLTGERLVYKNKEALMVEDRVLTKRQFIEAAELKSSVAPKQNPLAVFDVCAQKNTVSWTPESAPVSTAKKSDRKNAEDMTAEDEVRLRGLSSEDAAAAYKRLKYFRLQSQKNPQDAVSLAWQAECYMDLRNNSVQGRAGYSQDALVMLDEALALNQGKFHRTIYMNRIFAKIRLADKKGAVDDLLVLRKKAPGSFEARFMSAELAILDRKFEFAREWTSRASDVAKNNSEEQRLDELVVRLEESAERSEMAVPEHLLKLADEDRAKQQAVASQHEEEMKSYFAAEEYDQALKAGRQALSIIDTATVREFISKVIDKKAEELESEMAALSVSSRTPASEVQPENNGVQLSELKISYENLLREGEKICTTECEPVLRRRMLSYAETAGQNPKDAGQALLLAERILKKNPGHEIAQQVKEKLQAAKQP